jgi:hypothetical protein
MADVSREELHDAADAALDTAHQKGYDEGYDQGITDATQDNEPPALDSLVYVHPPTVGYGEALVEHVLASDQVSMMPFIADQYGAKERDWVLDPQNKTKLETMLDASVPPLSPVVFLDMEKSQFKEPGDGNTPELRRRKINYRLSVLTHVREHRPDLNDTRFLCWKAPTQVHRAEHFTDEFIEIQRQWLPVINDAQAVAARCFRHYDDMRDHEWAIPYIQFCLQLAGGLPVIPTVTGLTSLMENANRDETRRFWEAIRSVKVDGIGIAGLDIFVPYKSKVPEKRNLTDPQEIKERDEQFIWAIDTALEIMS